MLRVHRVLLPILFAAISGLAVPALPFDDIDYHDCGYCIVGSADVACRPRWLTVADDRLYVVDDEGLGIYALDDPRRPRLLSHTLLGCGAQKVRIWNRHAFLYGEACGLRIYDVSDPTAPVFVSTYYPSRPLGDIAVQGDRVYAVSDDEYVPWFQTVDISDLAAPTAGGFEEQLTLYLPIEGVRTDIVYGSLYLMADKLRAYDIDADPPRLRDIGTRSVRLPYDCTHYGSRLYYGTGSGLGIVDIAAPDDLQEIVPDFPTTAVRAVAYEGERLYLGRGDRRLLIADVDDPAAPAIVDTVWLPGATIGAVAAKGCVEVAVEGAGLYAVAGVPGTGSIGAMTGALGEEGSAATLVGSYAHFATDTGLQTWDVSDPADPRPTARLDLPGIVFDVAAADGFLYAAAGTSGLIVAGGAGGPRPVGVGCLPLPNVRRVEPVGDVCWVLDSLRGLCACDVTDPAAPALISTLWVSSNALHLCVYGNRAYLACQAGGVRVVDVSDPAAPVLLASLPYVGYAMDVAVSGSLLVVGVDGDGLLVYDLSDPAGPMLTARIYPDDESGVMLVGATPTVAYAATWSHRLVVLDVSDRRHPYEIGAFTLSGQPNSLRVDRGGVILSTDEGTFDARPRQIDVSPLAAPVLVGSQFATQRLFQWAVPDDPSYVESWLFRAPRPGEYPEEPIFRGGLGWALEPYLGAATYALRHRDAEGRFSPWSAEISFAGVAPADPPAAAVSFDIAPNPFNPTTTIGFSLTAETDVTLEIHDLRGRLVRRFSWPDCAAGEHRREWDGRDAEGRELPAGTYTLKLQAQGAPLLRKATLLK